MSAALKEKERRVSTRSLYQFAGGGGVFYILRN